MLTPVIVAQSPCTNYGRKRCRQLDLSRDASAHVIVRGTRGPVPGRAGGFSPFGCSGPSAPGGEGKDGTSSRV